MPKLIMLMKLFAELSIQIVSLSLITRWTESRDVILSYIAIMCVENIDEIYYNNQNS